jgi:hypothetical protein
MNTDITDVVIRRAQKALALAINEFISEKYVQADEVVCTEHPTLLEAYHCVYSDDNGTEYCGTFYGNRHDDGGSVTIDEVKDSEGTYYPNSQHQWHSVESEFNAMLIVAHMNEHEYTMQ